MPKRKGADPNDPGEFQKFDVMQGSDQEFEDFDVMQEPQEDAEVADEALSEFATSDDEAKSLFQARDELEKRLLIDPLQTTFAAGEDGPAGLGNVVGVGIGEKEVGGVLTGQLAVKVFVKEKLDLEDVSSEAAVPATLGGVQTDVDVTGEVYSQSYTARYRPAPGGVSIGPCNKVLAGTLGCLVTRSGQLFILSNNHVMAGVNAGPLNMGIAQPGRLDGGVCPQDIIARLTQWINITFAGACNYVDAAIARTSPALVDRRIIRPGGGRQSLTPSFLPAALNMQVQKSGRTTQYRRGFVDAINVTVNVNYPPHGVARFCNQFRVRGIGAVFSSPGDSGSLVTTFPANRPVGLLFAGNAANNMTFCNDIRTVLAAFGAAIVY